MQQEYTEVPNSFSKYTFLAHFPAQIYFIKRPIVMILIDLTSEFNHYWRECFISDHAQSSTSATSTHRLQFWLQSDCTGSEISEKRVVLQVGGQPWDLYDLFLSDGPASSAVVAGSLVRVVGGRGGGHELDAMIAWRCRRDLDQLDRVCLPPSRRLHHQGLHPLLVTFPTLG